MMKITRDSNANLKILRRLEKDGLIEIHDVAGENEAKKVKIKESQIFVWDYSGLDNKECILTKNGDVYDGIIKIIGKDNFKDAIKLEAHVRENLDYFVTEDNDFLSNKEKLKDKFNVRIVTPKELEKICKR